MHVYADRLEGKTVLAFLLVYTSDQYSIEHLWVWFKLHTLAHYFSVSIAEFSITARGKVKPAQWRTTLIAAF